MFHRKDQIVFSKDSPSSVLGGHSKPLTFACLPGEKKNLELFGSSKNPILLSGKGT